jgi:hypothetical protein
LTPEAAIYFGEIAEQYRTSNRVADASSNADKAAAAQAKILLIGHTDDTGSSDLNADLSERRARTVARLFADHGIAPENVFYQGAGETLPIADNHTAEGRSANRRVEIVDLTGAEPDILESYVSSRVPKYQYYRAVPMQSDASMVDVRASKAIVATDKAKHRTVASRKHAATETQVAETQTFGSPAAAIVAKSPVTTSSVTPAAPVRAIQPSAPPDSIDFGWHEVAPAALGLQFAAAPEQSSTFSLLSSAVASAAPVSKSCVNDRPRVSRAIKSVADDRAVPVRDHMQNLYGSSWGAKLKDQYLALKDVSVLRNGTAPGTRPTLLVWKDIDRNGLNGSPQVSVSPDVNAYAVKGGVLYRVFVKSSALFDCADILFSNGKATAGELVRRGNDHFFTVDYVPVIART